MFLLNNSQNTVFVYLLFTDLSDRFLITRNDNLDYLYMYLHAGNITNKLQEYPLNIVRMLRDCEQSVCSLLRLLTPLPTAQSWVDRQINKRKPKWRY